MNREFHVAKNGSDSSRGTKEQPFLTINRAASSAQAGDTIIVHEGTYREWVKPQNNGMSNERRITYKAADGEKVIIKGSERIQDWENIEGSIWKTEVPNQVFNGFNPYAEEVNGDWILYDAPFKKHLGDIYLNGMSFYEAENYEQLVNPPVRQEITDHWTRKVVPVFNPEQTKYLWFAEVKETVTTIYANFHDANPNEELVEINVRKCCFYPERTGIDYITVQGFEMAQAACPWAPPTAAQPGMLGANWSKGWIIEDNLLHDAKCSAISIGKESSTGNNYYTHLQDKPGYQYQLESVFSAREIGWNKERIGSHVIRNNTIYDCGQNAIVGHLGCVFSEIYQNHIFRIALKREFYGHEIAGIKLHAAIDVQIYHNRIHDCSLGIWLDWQTQGTRISKNICYRNNRDLFVEVSHGPYLIDHNVFASAVEMDNFSQGGAYINNLFCGHFNIQKVLDRATPYHYPHSTKVAGFAVVYGGDDRFFNNIFVKNSDANDKLTGTAHYNASPTSMEEYMEKVQAGAPGDLGLFMKVEQPVYIDHNIYFKGAEGFAAEDHHLTLPDFDPRLQIEEEDEKVYLSLHLPEEFDQFNGNRVTTKTLANPRIVQSDFETPDGDELVLDTDFFENQKTTIFKAGPFNELQSGENRLKIWG